MSSVFEFCDELGPRKVLHVYEPGADLRAIVVVDNVAAGPAIGGVRMASDASLDECFRLARAMTFKNAAAGLPHGGGKAVIQADPGLPAARREDLVRAFARAIATLDEYIPGPDMGTNETAMAWIRDETGRAVGLPRVIGGIPLDEIGATGRGLAAAAEVACGFAGIGLEGARFAVQGFGSVGTHAARFLAARGAVLVAASDSAGAVHAPAGIDVDALIRHKHDRGRVGGFEDAVDIEHDALVGIDCDIWIPAARPDVIHLGNAGQVRARLIVQGANIGVTEDAERELHQRGVLCVPDFISNAGGVICASVEYHGGSEPSANAVIEEKLARNTREVLERAAQDHLPPRDAARRMAMERLRQAMELRRW